MKNTVVPVALGALITAIAGATYYGLEWAWRSYDDHDRGLWEGLSLVYIITIGTVIAKWFMKRRRV